MSDQVLVRTDKGPSRELDVNRIAATLSGLVTRHTTSDESDTMTGSSFAVSPAAITRSQAWYWLPPLEHVFGVHTAELVA